MYYKRLKTCIDKREKIASQQVQAKPNLMQEISQP
jgi:hypothetical protein